MKIFKLLTKVRFFLLVGILFSGGLYGQCPAQLNENSATFGQADGTSISFVVPSCPSGFPASITINGVTFNEAGGCFGTEHFYSTSTPIGLPAGYTVDIGGTICEYDASGNLIDADVPTLSEWGLIVLALLFMTMGTLYLINNKELALKK